MGAHIGMAWTVFYNFLVSFTDTCDIKRSSSLSGVHTNNAINAKRIGSYTKDSKATSISTEWQDHQKQTRDVCSTYNDKNAADGTIHEPPCTYSFMVNRMTSISKATDVDRKIKEILVSVSGWQAEGYPIRQPRAGWYAKVEDASFSLKVEATMDTKFVTILSMKSYGDNFKGTKLAIEFRTLRASGENDRAMHEITGYHTTKTSIHVPHKFELPNGGVKKGESVLVDVRLVSGSYFKIAGLAFCRY
mmetsp:Transcript_19999/g.42083  ORF Transcript_19999/g.42083 Transcript_19999/m.42083 type:complete len:247 (-) Transcript_19999:476-1216(-)